MKIQHDDVQTNEGQAVPAIRFADIHFNFFAVPHRWFAALILMTP
ncbi:hypothetical protein [Nitratireductor basaltis]|nr:hypothetical protein [Nitratireductor basaltis]